MVWNFTIKKRYFVYFLIWFRNKTSKLRACIFGCWWRHTKKNEVWLWHSYLRYAKVNWNNRGQNTKQKLRWSKLFYEIRYISNKQSTTYILFFKYFIPILLVRNLLSVGISKWFCHREVLGFSRCFLCDWRLKNFCFWLRRWCEMKGVMLHLSRCYISRRWGLENSFLDDIPRTIN